MKRLLLFLVGSLAFAQFTPPSGGGTSISLTTTGSSGAATLSGGVLNIPVYSAAAVSSFNTRTGAVTLSAADVNTATGCTFSSGALTCNSFSGTGSDPFINLPSNTGHSGSAGDLWNNAGVLKFGATPLNVVVTNGTPGVGIAHFAGSTQTVTSSAVSLTADVSGLLPAANMVNSGVFTGDVTTTFPAVTVAKVNGIAYSATAAAHSVEVITTANTTATAKVIPDCTDVGGNHLNFTQSSDAFSCGTSSLVKHQYGGVFGTPGGSALSTGGVQYFVMPQACTINGYNLLADAGTFTVKFWKIASGTAIPTVSNVINTSGVALSSGTALESSTTSDFTTTTVTAGDIGAVTVTAVSGAGYIYAAFTCQ